MPDEKDDAIVHYAPGEHPLCGTESMTAVYTDDPALVAGCPDCLELAAENLVRGQRALGELPPLPAGDLRPERRRVAARRPPALPALREARMVRRPEITVEKIAKLRRHVRLVRGGGKGIVIPRTSGNRESEIENVGSAAEPHTSAFTAGVVRAVSRHFSFDSVLAISTLPSWLHHPIRQ